MKKILLFISIVICTVTNAQVQNFNTQVRFKNVDEITPGDSIQVLVRDGDTNIVKWIHKDSISGKPTLDYVLSNGRESDDAILLIRDTANTDNAQWKLAVYNGNDGAEKGGQLSLQYLSDGYLNFAVNNASGTSTTSTNLYYGAYALNGLTRTASINSANNTAIGTNSLRVLSAGVGRNASLGSETGRNLENGGYNTLLGYRAGYVLVNGNHNTIVGRTEAGLPTTLNDNIIIATGKPGSADIGFRVTETGLTTVPKQTQTTYNSDSSGKAIVTKEILNNAISSIPEIDTSNFLAKDATNEVTEDFEITNGDQTIKFNGVSTVDIENESGIVQLGGSDWYYYGVKSSTNFGDTSLRIGGIEGIFWDGASWTLDKNPDDTINSKLYLPQTGSATRRLAVSVDGEFADEYGNIELNNYLKKDALNEVTEDFQITSDKFWTDEFERHSIIENTADVAGGFCNVKAGVQYNLYGDNPIIGFYNQSDNSCFSGGGNSSSELMAGGGSYFIRANHSDSSNSSSSYIEGSSDLLRLVVQNSGASSYNYSVNITDDGVWINGQNSLSNGYKLPNTKGNVGEVLTADTNGNTIWSSDKYVQVLNKTHSISSTGAFEIDLLDVCPDIDISQYSEWDIVWTNEVSGKKVLYNLKALGWVEDPLLGQYSIGDPMCISLSGSSKKSFTIPSNAKLILRK